MGVRWNPSPPGGPARAAPAAACAGTAAHAADAGAVTQAGPAHWPARAHPVNAPTLPPMPRGARNDTARDLAAKHLAVTGASGATDAARCLASLPDRSSPLAGSSSVEPGPRTVRITVQVRPGSAHPGVGGRHDGALVVRVRERAVAGQATAAALAAAFGVRRHAVTLVTGESSRTKIVDVAGADPAGLDRLLAL